MISFRFLDEARSNWVDDVEALLFELTKRPVKITREQLLDVICKSRVLAALENDDKIVAMATLVPMHIPTGLCGYIHNVVRLSAYRGGGLGEELMKGLFAEAKRMRMRYVSLTSNPGREAANRLYLKLGMVPYETNHYRLVL